MKKLTPYLYFSLLAAVSASCADPFNVSGNLQPALKPRYLKISQTNIDFRSAAAEEITVKVQSSGTPWTFAQLPDWLTVAPASGTGDATVVFAVGDYNNANVSRSQTFTFRSTDSEWAYERKMEVSQPKAVAKLSVDRTDLTSDGAATRHEVRVTANCEWQASCNDSWIQLSADKEAGRLVLDIAPNSGEQQRRGTVVIRYGNNASVAITVKQDAAQIETSAPVDLNVEHGASKYDLEVQAQTQWTADVSDSWIQVTPDAGNAGKTSVAIELAPNTTVRDREGFVSFKTGSSEKLHIRIKQDGLYLRTDSLTEFNSLAGSKNLGVRSNTDWEVISAPAWLTVNPTTGKGDANLTLTIADNPNSTLRQGDIVFGFPGLDIETRATVVQNGKYLTTDSQLLQFTDREGQQQFNIQSDALWSSAPSVEWLSATPVNGNGNAEITVHALENTSVDERDGLITYTYADASTAVDVHQLAKYLTIANAATQFDSKGGALSVGFTTNDNWTVEDKNNVSWLTIAPKSGEGSATVQLTATDNPSVNKRSTEVFIRPRYAQQERLMLEQLPRYLSVSTASLEFFSKGGNSEVIDVTTDGTYDVKTDVEWLKAYKLSGNRLRVTAQVNPDNVLRDGNVTVYLTDLVEGTKEVVIPVHQTCKGGTFVVNGYQQDGDWNRAGNNKLSITVKAYTTDQNWNAHLGSKLQLNVTGYSEDGDWNRHDKSNINVTITPHPGDSDWN